MMNLCLLRRAVRTVMLVAIALPTLAVAASVLPGGELAAIKVKPPE